MFKRGKMKASQLGREVGLSHVTIGNYLVGRPPKSEHLVKIARYFSVSTDWLLGLVGEPANWDELASGLSEAPAESELEIWKRRAKKSEKELAELKEKLQAALKPPDES